MAAKNKKPNRSYLQEQRRRKEQRRVTEPMTGREIRQETRQQTNLRFRPLEREIGAQIRGERKRTRQVGDWWNQYLQEVNRGRGEVQAAYDAAGAASGQRMEQATAMDNANVQRLGTEEAASAALRGVEPSAAPAQRAAAMQAQRNYLATAQAGTTSQLGANQYSYLTDQRRIGVGHSIGARKAGHERTRSLERDRLATRRERGDYAATKRTELRENEFNKQVQRSAFNLDKREAAQDAQDAAAKNQIAAQNASTSAGNLRQREREENYDRSQDQKGGGKKNVPEGQRNAMATARSIVQKAGAWPTTAKGWAQLEEDVRKESEVSPAEARRAVQALRRRREKKAKQDRRQDAREHGWID